MFSYRISSAITSVLLPWIIFSCSEEAPDTQFDYAPEEAAVAMEIAPEQLAFWENIQAHCGNAYRGELADATPYYQSFEADEITIHVRECSESLTHISLHLDNDHSRNLLLTKAEGTLRLKHDHRNEDGSEKEVTQYGGDAPKPGLETRQIFEADAHTSGMLPKRSDNFWFLDLMDAETLAYGVHWPKQGHSIRMEFDLTEPVEAPPAPWGYEEE